MDVACNNEPVSLTIIHYIGILLDVPQSVVQKYVWGGGGGWEYGSPDVANLTVLHSTKDIKL